MPFGEDTKELEFMSHSQGNLGVGEPGFFSGFGKGVGMYAMKGFAETARAIDLLGSVPPVLMDKLSGGTTRGDQYFQQHEDVFGSAVDYWTPKAGEVGAAGQIIGSLAGALPQIMVNPALGVGTAVLAPAEDLTKAGVGTGAAITVGMIQGAALAAGIRMPFLGSTLATKMATGAGGNLLQGVLAAAGSKGVLKAGGYDQAAEGFQPFDVTQRAVDILMGLAFGGLAHLDAKAQAAYRAAFTEDVKNALLVKNQAMQLDAIANSYKAVDDLPEHLNVKVNKVQEAVEQALRGEPVNVDRGTEGLFSNTPEATRIWHENVHAEAVTTAKAVLNEAVQRNNAIIDAQETPGFLRTPEQMLALKAGQIEPTGSPELRRAVEIINKPGFMRTPEERIFLDSVMQGKAFDHMFAEIPRPGAVEPGYPTEPAAAGQRLSTDIERIAALPREVQAEGIGRAVEAHLVSQGMDPVEANANAATWKAMFKTIGETEGVAPADIMRDYNLDIRKLGAGETLTGGMEQAGEYWNATTGRLERAGDVNPNDDGTWRFTDSRTGEELTYSTEEQAKAAMGMMSKLRGEETFFQALTAIRPSSKLAVDDHNLVRVPGLEEALKPGAEQALDTNIKLFESPTNVAAGVTRRTYDSIRVEGDTPQAKAESIIMQMQRNLLTIFDAIPESTRSRSKLWYDGAQLITAAMARRYGLTDMQAAGLFAALSPQADWRQNISYGERILDVLKYRQDHAWDPKMDAWADKFIKQTEAAREKLAGQRAAAVEAAYQGEREMGSALRKAQAVLAKTEPMALKRIDDYDARITLAKDKLKGKIRDARAEIRAAEKAGDEAAISAANDKLAKAQAPIDKLVEKMRDERARIADAKAEISKNETQLRQATRRVKEKRAVAAEVDPNVLVQDLIRGKKLGDLETDFEKAWWIRAYDEAHNPRSFKDVSPEGHFLGPVLAMSGKPEGIGWKSFDAIAKAVSIARDGSAENVHAQLGDMHKVRNFYNNIYDPNSPHPFVTSDTHQVAGNLFLPLGGDAAEVGHNFGGMGTSQAGTDLQGTYWMHHEAVVRAARERGVLPREMQSITWEGIRALFSPEFKSNKAKVEQVRDLWREYHDGRSTYEDTVRKVIDLAGGKFRDPTWLTLKPGEHSTVEDGATSYESGLQHARFGFDERAQSRVTSGDRPEVRQLEQTLYQGADANAVHLGDGGIARDTMRHRMDGGRSTGHFGTGVYFLSDAAARDSNEAANPVSGRYGRSYINLDTEGHNLAKPGNPKTLHDGLREINRLAGNDNPIEFGMDHISSQAEKAAFNLAIELGMRRRPEIEAAIKAEVAAERAGLPDSEHRTAGTRVMQRLGYDGVDVRGTPYDNTEYGSVIYPKRSITAAEQATLEAGQKRQQIIDELTPAHRALLQKAADAWARYEQTPDVGPGSLLPRQAAALSGTATKAINAFEKATGENGMELIAYLRRSSRFEAFDDIASRAGSTLEQPGARGAIRFSNGDTVIGLFENADKTTFQHETGHFFLQVIRDLADRPGASEAAMTRWSAIAKWLGVEGGEITRAQHEKWAEGWETYLGTGEAPTPELRTAFQQFRDWIVETYKSLTGRVEFSPEVKAEVDKMLGSQAADPAAKQFESTTRQNGPGARQPDQATTPRPGEAAPEGGGKPPAGEARKDPLVDTAQTIAGERPDLQVPTGELDADGRPVTMKVGDYLAVAEEASRMNQADAGIFRAALTCMLAAL